MYYSRLLVFLVFVLCFSGRCVAQTNDSTSAKPVPPTSVTLLMDWSRGDSYYGSHFIQLRSPCQAPSEQKCECVMQFKGMSSKDNSAEFADYVSSFEHNKVPVTFKLSYTAEGIVSGVYMLGVGTWKNDVFPVNDTLLGVKISISRGAPGHVQHAPIPSSGDCFPASVSAQTPDLLAMSDADLKTVTIQLERIGCFGTCPAYSVTIHGDGQVAYSGKSHVKETGMHEGRIGMDKIKALTSEFAKNKFWGLAEDYSEATCSGRVCTDMATAITELTVKGVTHRVKHYYGCGSAPKSLFFLEAAIDESANSAQWTGDVSKAGPFGTTCFAKTE